MLTAVVLALLIQQFTVEPAPAWDALFVRREGWTGADGIHSIPLDGKESPGGMDRADTLFLFSDTFVGQSRADGSRHDTNMVNNSSAWLRRGAPLSELRFHYGGTQEKPVSLFAPSTPNAQPGEWYWPHDGIARDGAVHFFAHRFKRSNEGLGFARAGLAMITLPHPDRPPFSDAEQRDCPFYEPAGPEGVEITFGCAILDNAGSAGAPHPDGWLYVTGVREAPGKKWLLCARVPPAELRDWQAWRFWDGTSWTEDFRTAAPVADRVSPEHSISPMADGRFLLIYQADTISRVVAARIGTAPQGPYGEQIALYTVPIPAEPKVWTYNSKAHPHLSAPGELLVSYHVNPTDFWDNFRHADAYRPRFLRVRWSANGD